MDEFDDPELRRGDYDDQTRSFGLSDDPPTEPVPVQVPSPAATSTLGSTRRRGAEPTPIVADDETPLLRRTGVLMGVVGGVALACAIGVGVAAFAFGHNNPGGDNQPSSAVALPTASPLAAAPSSTDVAPPPPPPPPAPPAPTTTVAAAPTTSVPPVTTEAPKPPPTSAPKTSSVAAGPSSGRFSGTIARKKGNVWTITGWDGSTTTVHIVGSTRLVAAPGLFGGGEFTPGQTVNVFWHTKGNIVVADSVYVAG